VNPCVLAVDTTGEFGSIAIARGDDLVGELLLHSTEGFAHVLFDQLRTLLDRHGIGAADIDCFAAAAGPGSFTGVRIGLSAVKGLAEAYGKPVVPVSNLQAVAFSGTQSLRAAVLDARRGEVYAGLFDSAGEPVVPEAVTTFAAWLSSLPGEPIEFLSTDFSPFRMALDGTRFRGASITEVPRALAGPIARIAAARYAQGAAVDPAAADANYVRRSDAELLWKE
jgi:tRNA threonylcarbamoyladenosine biosynthesis protein TsaB